MQALGFPLKTFAEFWNRGEQEAKKDKASIPKVSSGCFDSLAVLKRLKYE